MQNISFRAMAHNTRWWWAIVLFWSFLVSISYAWQFARLEDDAIEMATLRGRLVFSMVQLTRRWNAGHGGLYAAITPGSPPNPYLVHPDKFAESRKGKLLTLINPAYMTRQMNELLAKQTDLKTHLTSLKPLNPDNKADEWEHESLVSFESGTKERLSFQRLGEEEVFRYMAPLYVEQACLQCHEKQGYKLGQIRGGLSVTQPATYVSDIIHKQKLSILLVHVTTFLLLSFVSLLGLWQIRKQFVQLENSRDERATIAHQLEMKLNELADTRNQLLQSEQLASIGQLAAGVAHEINNPIGYVYSNLGTLETYVQEAFALIELYEQAEASIADKEVLARLASSKAKLDINYLKNDLRLLFTETKEGIARVKAIVQNLKDFSHVDSSDEWRFSNLHKGLDSTLSIVNSEIKNKAEIVKDYGDIPEVECIAQQLNQVFMNLLLNAAHAIQGHGIITISTGQENDEVWVAFRDTGQGILPEHMQRIFDPFFTTQPIGTGTGLGLSYSYGIVQKHHGRIEVQSEVGKGSVFRVCLPIKQPEESPD